MSRRGGKDHTTTTQTNSQLLKKTTEVLYNFQAEALKHFSLELNRGNRHINRVYHDNFVTNRAKPTPDDNHFPPLKFSSPLPPCALEFGPWIVDL